MTKGERGPLDYATPSISRPRWTTSEKLQLAVVLFVLAVLITVLKYYVLDDH